MLLPGEYQGWRSLVGCHPWGRWGSGTTERLHFHFSLSCIGEGNGNPLQCYCLENPMDGGAWWAAVHGVTESQTWLSNFTFTFHFHALEKEIATHSSVLACGIPGTGEPGRLLSTGSHKVRHSWSDLAAAAADYNPLGSSVHGILQARILEWVAISFSRGYSQPRGQTCISELADGVFTTEPPWKHIYIYMLCPNIYVRKVYIFKGGQRWKEYLIFTLCHHFPLNFLEGVLLC